MNISELSDIEYKYLLDIDELREASRLSSERNSFIQKSPYFTPETKKKINGISQDLSCMIDDIVERKNIKSIDNYSDALDAITLANTDIQIAVSKSTLNGQFEKFKMSHPIYKEYMEWQKIQQHISTKEWFNLLVQNHKTSFLFVLIGFVAAFIVLCGALSKNFWLLLCSLILIFIFIIGTLVVALFRSVQVERDYYIDHLYRTKNYTQFKSKEVLKSKNTFFLRLFSSLHK